MNAHDLELPTDDDMSGDEWLARDAGLDVRHDMRGFYVLTDAEAEHEDEGNPSVGFDGRAHFETIEEAWEAAAEIAGNH